MDDRTSYPNEKIRGSAVDGTKAKTLSAELTDVFVLEDVKKEVQCWTHCKECFRGGTEWADKSSHYSRMCGLCLANPKEQKWLVKFRRTGLRRLSAYLATGTRLEIQSNDVKLLIWCCLSLLLFFYLKRQDEKCVCYGTRNLDKSKTLFRSALYLLLPEKQEEVIRAVIRFLTLTSQWNTEEYDSFVFQELLAIVSKPELIVAKIIKQVEVTQREKEIGAAFEISCSLSNILEHTHWDKYLFNHLLHNCLNTLLKVYILCNTPMSSPMKVANAKFRMIIKTCIKYFISNIKDNKAKPFCITYSEQITFCGPLVAGRQQEFEPQDCNASKAYYSVGQTFWEDTKDLPGCSALGVKLNSKSPKCFKKGDLPLSRLMMEGGGFRGLVIFAKASHESEGFSRTLKTELNYCSGLVSVLDSVAKCLQDQTITSEDRIDLVELIAFCAQKHHTKFYRESLTPDLLDLLLRNILSGEQIIAMSSHKIFHYLLDRHDNQRHFVEPVYYFKGRSNFTINSKYSVEDVHFFRNFSRTFLDGIYHCFLTFTEKYALVTCYVTLCLVLVEIPEPVITINIIHMLITLQNDILKNDNLSMTVKSQIHAIISALLSLICVIHEGEVNTLKKYVEEVVGFRTENSPHLLPPLQNKYIVASHHTSEYHDQLYFLEDEVLYALQRCWLSRKNIGSR